MASDGSVVLLFGERFTMVVKKTTRRLTISLDEDDYRQVAMLADAEERSLNWVITRALKQYLRERRLGQQAELFQYPSVSER